MNARSIDDPVRSWVDHASISPEKEIYHVIGSASRSAMLVVLCGAVAACAGPSNGPTDVPSPASPAPSTSTSGESVRSGNHPGTTQPATTNSLRSTKWTSATNFRCPSSDQQVVLDKVVYGDFTGDGKDDAVVALTCTTATSTNPLNIEAFDGASSPDHPESLGVLVSFDDPLYVEKVDIAITGSTVNLAGAGLGPDAALAAGPTVRFTQSFTYQSGRLQPAERHTSK